MTHTVETTHTRPRRSLAGILSLPLILMGLVTGAGTTPAMASNRPVVTITSPTAGWTFTSNSVTVDFGINRTPKQISSETCSLTPGGAGNVVGADCTPTSATTGSTTAASFTNLPNGTYTFNAKVTLTDGGTAAAGETITVNLAPPVYNVAVEGVAKSTDSNGNTTHPNVLIVPQFTDPLGYQLTVTVSSQPANGTVTANGDGTFTYTPTADAQNAVARYDFMNVVGTTPNPAPPTSDSFTLTADDGHGGTVSHVVTVPISPYYDLTTTSDTIEMQLLGLEPLILYEEIDIGTIDLIPVELNLDTSFQFSTDPSDYVSPPTVTIGSCATDPTNTMCATPPPPPSPTSTQQIPPLPLADYYGEATGHAFLAQVISSATAAAGGGGTIAASVIYDVLTAVEVLCDW